MTAEGVSAPMTAEGALISEAESDGVSPAPSTAMQSGFFEEPSSSQWTWILPSTRRKARVHIAEPGPFTLQRVKDLSIGESGHRMSTA